MVRQTIQGATALILVAVALQTAPAQAAAQVPLFESDAVLEVTLEADFKALRGDRSQESEERPGRVLWSDSEGQQPSADVLVKTRGNFRLNRKNCRMPPLRLNFKTGTMEGTPFEGQDKIKLVTYCRDKDDYEENVAEEFLVYRLYNRVTDLSFRVRPLRLTYVDTSGDDDPITRFAFLIEDEDALAERLQGRMVEIPAAHPESFVTTETPMLAVFQYMVGNTDWSMVQFHNVKLLQRADGSAIPIPYDFDWTGLVSAPYARPDESLGIRNVRQRVYRGFCRDVDFGALYSRFSELEPDFMEVVATAPGISDDNRKKVREYLSDFYEVISDQGKAKRQIEGDCRSMP